VAGYVDCFVEVIGWQNVENRFQVLSDSSPR
jgi:hypothetical protein